MLDRVACDINRIPAGVLRYGLVFSIFMVLAFVMRGEQIFQITALRNESYVQDFWAFHAAAQSISDGMVAPLYDFRYFQSLFSQELGGMFWLYPPTMLILLEPFGVMSYGQAKISWVLINVIGIAVATFYCSNRNVALTFFAIISPAVFSVLYTGQLSVIFAILLAVGLLQSKTRPILAGLCIGILSMKPQFGILVPFFLIFTGAWRAFMYAAVVTILLVAGSVALYGVEAWVGFWHSLTTIHFNAVRSPTGIGRVAFLDVLKLGGMSAGLSLAFAGTAMLMGILILRSAIGLGANTRALSALTIMLTIATTPSIWVYDWGFVLLAVVLFLSAAPFQLNRSTQFILLIVWVAPLLPYFGGGVDFRMLIWGSGAALVFLIYNNIRFAENESLYGHKLASEQS